MVLYNSDKSVNNTESFIFIIINEFIINFPSFREFPNFFPIFKKERLSLKIQ